MEASKCPKCGDEPSFLEHIDKWYCFGCNTYVEENGSDHAAEPCGHEQEEVHEDHSEEIASELKSLEDEPKETCKKCGAWLEHVGDGRLYCFTCETYPADAVLEPEEPHKPNEAQALLDTLTVSPPRAPEPQPAPAVPEVKLELAPAPEVPKAAEEPKPAPGPEVRMCPSCGQPLKFIEKYHRHYCYGCRKYAAKDAPSKSAAPAPKAAPEGKACPECGGSLKFIEKYNEFYCHTCRKYPLHKKAEAPAKPKELTCPKCKGQLKLVEKYQRHYCFECKEYAPKGYGGNGHSHSEKKICPACSEEMKFVSEYNEWYCFKCKKYSLRPSKPVLLI